MKHTSGASDLRAEPPAAVRDASDAMRRRGSAISQSIHCALTQFVNPECDKLRDLLMREEKPSHVNVRDTRYEYSDSNSYIRRKPVVYVLYETASARVRFRFDEPRREAATSRCGAMARGE